MGKTSGVEHDVLLDQRLFGVDGIVASKEDLPEPPWRNLASAKQAHLKARDGVGVEDVFHSSRLKRDKIDQAISQVHRY